MICSRKEGCKTCTQEKYDKWNAFLKNYKGENNPWLCQNEKIVDFIRWYELGYYVVMFPLFCLIWGWWGVVIFVIFDKLNHLQGGPLVDMFNELPKKKPTILHKENKECKLGQHVNCIYI